GIFEQGSTSMDDYHRSWDRMRRAHGGQRQADDAGIVLDRLKTWHPCLPAPPRGFPGEVAFDLTGEEADFLQERIRDSCRGTLLAHAVDALVAGRPRTKAPAPWDAFPEGMPQHLVHDLVLARKFSVLMRGAARLYNLALA